MYIKLIFIFVCLFFGGYFLVEKVYWFIDYEDIRCYIINDY